MKDYLNFATGLFGGLITAFTALSSSLRNAQLEHITSERKKWREDIRKLSSEFVELTLKRQYENITKSALDNLEIKHRVLFNEILSRINPNDPADEKIITLMKALLEKESDISKNTQEFSMQISRLLKHDWERSKLEVKQSRYIFFILLIPIGLFIFHYNQYLELNKKNLLVYLKWITGLFFSYHVIKFLISSIDENRTMGSFFRKLFNVNPQRK